MVFNPDGRTVLCAMQDSLKVPLLSSTMKYFENLRDLKMWMLNASCVAWPLPCIIYLEAT